MIKVITGKPGTGKSYFATRYAMQEMIKGRRVFSNIRINFNHNGRTYTNYKLEKDDIKTIKFPKDSLLIVDEAGYWFNSREFKKFDIEDFQFFSQHRHLNIDIILVVQNMHRIDITLRELSDEILLCTSLLKVIFRQFVAYGLEEYTNNVFTFKRMFLLKRKYAQSYNTNQCLSNFEDRLEIFKLHEYDENNQITRLQFIKNILASNYDRAVKDDYTKILPTKKNYAITLLLELLDKLPFNKESSKEKG